MLKYLRTHRTGLFGAVILGFVCITMIGFGINFFAPQGPTQAVIKVNEREISYQEFQNRLNNYRAMLQQRLGDNFSQFASMINFEQQTIDQLVDRTLLDQFIAEMEISPSSALVAQRISALPYFNGVMTKANYTAFLRASGVSGPQLESSTRQELAINMFRSSFADLSQLTEPELKSIFLQSKKEMSFHLASFSPSDFESKVATDNEEKLSEYFRENQERYRQPAKVQYQTASFKAENYQSEVVVTQEDTEETYEQIKDTFSVAARVSFRRIMLKKDGDDSSTNPLDDMMGKDEASDSTSMSSLTHNQKQKAIAKDAQERIIAGDAFADVAVELSEDEVTKPNGGFVEPTEYTLLKEPFRSALFDLEEGEVSEVLEDSDGYYLVVAEKKVGRVTRPLADVEALVKRRIQSDFAPEYARVAAEEFLDALGNSVTTETFTSLASGESIPTAATIQPLQAGQSSGTIPVSVTGAAVVLAEGDIEIVEVDADTYVVLITKSIPAAIPEFSEIKQQVITDYKKEHARKLAKVAAEELLKTLTENKVDTSVISQEIKKSKAKLETTPLFVSATPSNPMFRNPLLLQSAFGLSSSSPILTSVQQSGNDYVVIAFAKQKLPEEDTFSSQRDALLAQERQVRGNRIFTTLQKLLRTEAQVWVEPTLLDSGPA